MKPTIRSAAFDHIGFGVHDIEAAHTFFTRNLGGKPYAGGPTPTFIGAQWSFADEERLEAIMPNGPKDGFLYRFLDQHGPGIHHVTFKVPDIHQACEAADEHGYDIVGFNDSNPGWKEAFLHPKQAQRMVIQFAQADPALDEDWDENFAFPPIARGTPSEPARIRGLRIRAADADKVRALWGDLIGARIQIHNRRQMELEWSNSPLRIFVTLDPGKPEGALAVEVDAGPTHELPPEKVPALGARFVPPGTPL